MQRAAARVFRATYTTVRSLSRVSTRANSRARPFFLPNSSAVASPSRSSQRAPHHVGESLETTLESAMFVRRLSVPFAVVSTLVGLGAWYSYDGTGPASLARSFTEGRAARTTTPGTGADGAGGVGLGAVPTRKVLVMGEDDLHTGTFVGEGPISKTTSDDGRKIVEMMTPEQATAALRKAEQSWLVNRGEGVVRYDVVQLPSNDPIEDDHAEQVISVPGFEGKGSEPRDWMFWGVFDGHRGWTTSATLRKALIGYVAKEVNETFKAAGTTSPAGEAIDNAIKSAFTRLDDDIVHRSVEKVFKNKNRAMAADILQPAYAGSCALLSFYDVRSKELRVACTGDSRAVLGRRSASGKWTATPLSVDQTGSNPDEAERMRKEHPGEEYVVKNGRVLGGLEPTRAFGDASYKWTREVSDKLKAVFFGSRPSPRLLTPPYVTAEPVVTTTKIQPDKGDFLVMATDGLWEMLTNEEVVGLVGKWIEQERAGGSSSASMWTKVFGSQGALPVEQGKAVVVEGSKTPIRQEQWGTTAASDRFVVKDRNVATHLIRNALGGKQDELVCALLTLPAPHSRRYRDDLTVQVIFFGQGGESGDVAVNQDATANAPPPKAKL